MRFPTVRWLHELVDDPLILYSEQDDERNEVRKFHAGRTRSAAAGNAISLERRSLPGHDPDRFCRAAVID